MLHRRQWINYKIAPVNSGINGDAPQGKSTKIPINPLTGTAASTANPLDWTDYATAAVTGLPCGYVFTADDPYFFIDLDGCRDAETGEWLPEALSVFTAFSGACTELSQSHTGAHIFGRCDKSRLIDRRNKWAGWLEFYTQGRFVAFGHLDPASVIGSIDSAPDFTETLLAFVPQRAPDETTDASTRRADWIGPEDDQELIQRMLASDGGTGARFDHKARPAALWNGDPHTLAEFFPPMTADKPFDHSSADQALMNVLSFWTGCDYDRMIRLFGMSGLGKRDKWRNRSYYRNRTTLSAIKTCRGVYQGNRADKAKALAAEQPEAVRRVLTLEEMISGFGILQYQSNKTTVINLNNFEICPRSVFEDVHAPSEMLMDEKSVPTTKLWLKSHDVQVFDRVVWDPAAPVACGRNVNTWRGFATLPSEPALADASLTDLIRPFTDHMSYMISNDVDRELFYDWLAHALQYPGKLPHSAWLLISPHTGTGRGWLSELLRMIFKGYVAQSVNIQKLIKSDYNGPLSKKLFAVVDEVHANITGSPFQFYEILKELVTQNDRVINHKYGLQVVERNCLRWIFCSNREDALPIDDGDRRFNVSINTAKPMPRSYYAHIYGLLHDPAEHLASAVKLWLLSRPIDPTIVMKPATLNADKLRTIEAGENRYVTALKEIAADTQEEMTTVKRLISKLRIEYPHLKIENDKSIYKHLRAAGFSFKPSWKDRVKVAGNAWERPVIIKGDRKIEDYWDGVANDFNEKTKDYIRDLCMTSIDVQSD